MTAFRMAVNTLLLGCLWLAGSEAARADLVGDVNSVVAWTRRPGQYSDNGNPNRWRAKSLDPSQIERKWRTKRLHDIQLDGDRYYRGVPLATLIALYKPAAGLDLAILHFENGMAIPISMNDLSRLDAFLAFEACNNQGKECAASFETVARKDVYGDQEDPRPIQFSWNKLVVGSLWYPGQRSEASNGFSPWRHVDSLSGIEFADEAAYFRQFAVGNSGGEEVFEARCQFCHAARFVGGRFGWDFVNPLSLSEKRPPANLTNHVKYQKMRAAGLGLQMPPQRDVELAEMTKLWHWMKDVSERPLRKYAP